MRKLLALCLLFFLPCSIPFSTADVRNIGKSESLLIAGGDLLHITVFGIPELEQHTRVLDSGSVKLSLIGEVPIAGLTPSEASRRIAEALKAGGFVRQAQVSILVEEFAVANVSVGGQVLHPGSYPMTAARNLLDVLSLAGGLTPLADVQVTIKRQAQAQGSKLVTVTVPNSPDRAMADAVMVYPGDLVMVPKAGIVYVLGDVNRPGGYVMQYDGQLTALQAIALAAGSTKTSAENHARLIRQTSAGPVETLLALTEMQKGKRPDLPLQPEDVLYVPFSTARNMMLGASAILSSTSGAAIYAAH